MRKLANRGIYSTDGLTSNFASGIVVRLAVDVEGHSSFLLKKHGFLYSFVTYLPFDDRITSRT